MTAGCKKQAAPAASPLAGSIALRIAPEDLPKLFDRLGKTGTMVRHGTETEDKTSDVIDAEAKIKNLTSYRDSLRGLLNRSSADLKDRSRSSACCPPCSRSWTGRRRSSAPAV